MYYESRSIALPNASLAYSRALFLLAFLGFFFFCSVLMNSWLFSSFSSSLLSSSAAGSWSFIKTIPRLLYIIAFYLVSSTGHWATASEYLLIAPGKSLSL